MLKVKPVSGITAIFGNSADKSPKGDDRLMDLYWNRNALKKEFAGLRTEKFKLTDRLKAQQGDMARLQQKLEYLEELLIDPEWARSIMVLYQLRGLDRRCSGRIARFAEQIKQQKEKKLNSQALAEWRAGIDREAGALNDEILGMRRQVLDLEQQVQQAHADAGRMSGLLRFFRRRSLKRRVEELAGRIREFEDAESQKRAELEGLAEREPPETMGLGLAAKRSVNLMILSYAQQLFLSFGDDDLVMLVREAADKSPGAVRYGSDRDCEGILARIRRSADSLASGGDCAEILQKRVRLIANSAVYEGGEDAVPLPATVATLYKIDSAGIVTTASADLLGQNFWGVSNVMSR